MKPLTVDDINGVNRDRRRFAKLNGQQISGGRDGRNVKQPWSAVGMSGAMVERGPRENTAPARPRVPTDTLLKDRVRVPEARYLGTHRPNKQERITSTLEALGLL